MRDQGDERTSFKTLIETGKLPADALLSPSEMNEGFYAKTLQKARQTSRGLCLMGGERGMFKKSPLSP